VNKTAASAAQLAKYILLPAYSRTTASSGVTDEGGGKCPLAAQMWAPLKKWAPFGFLCFPKQFYKL